MPITPIYELQVWRQIPELNDAILHKAGYTILEAINNAIQRAITMKQFKDAS